MVKSNDNGSNSVAPFLNKCYEMVDDESTDSIISWGQSNDSFIIWDVTEFSVQLLPKYFKHSNFSSFIRQLNIYVSLICLSLLLLLWAILNQVLVLCDSCFDFSFLELCGYFFEVGVCACVVIDIGLVRILLFFLSNYIFYYEILYRFLGFVL